MTFYSIKVRNVLNEYPVTVTYYVQGVNEVLYILTLNKNKHFIKIKYFYWHLTLLCCLLISHFNLYMFVIT